MSETTSWRAEFKSAQREASDTSSIVAVAPEGVDLDRNFYAGYGGSEGEPILIWTEQRVYFPVTYDGAEWLGSAPRDPTTHGQPHVGGE